MKIAPRNLVMLSAGIFLLVVAAFHLIVISPAIARQKDIEKRIEAKVEDIHKMETLQRQWHDFQRKRTEAEKILNGRGRGFTLLTFVERISREVGIDKHIQYIKPMSFTETEGLTQPIGIELRYEGLDTKDLVNFLYRVEQSRNLLRIDRIKIQPAGTNTGQTLEVTLQISTYVLVKTGIVQQPAS